MRVLYVSDGVVHINSIKEVECRGYAVLCKTVDNDWLQILYEVSGLAKEAVIKLLKNGYLDASNATVKR